MPTQETFFIQQSKGHQVEVLKSYDQRFAKEVFGIMDDVALQHLWESLRPEEQYAAEELPTLGAPDGEAEAFLWDELLEQAREDGSLLSFFVVNESFEQKTNSLYVSPDWPSAEAYAKRRIMTL